MYGCESWTIKKAEHQRIDAFGLWCWRRCLRVPWTARRANQSILKQISPEYSLEGLMLKLKLQYFGHLMWRADSLGKILMLGKTEGRGEGDDRGWDGWLASLTQWTWVWVNSGSWWWTARPGVLQPMGLQRVGHDWATELNWTEKTWPSCTYPEDEGSGEDGEVRLISNNCNEESKSYMGFTWACLQARMFFSVCKTKCYLLCHFKFIRLPKWGYCNQQS